MPAIDMKSLIGKLAQGTPLDEGEIKAALTLMIEGAASPAQMGAFLMALRVRGETVGEITGAAALLRERMLKVEAPEGTIDIVGTGGDSHGTYNVSTAAALVVAGAGVRVAKHGNRSVSSLSGASDVLAALGVKLDCALARLPAVLAGAGVAFLWAPMHHAAMKHFAPIRADLGIRTIFNLLGPLANPAGVRRQLVGVYDARWVEPVAHVLRNLGATRAWVVHGSDGLDEITTTGLTKVAELIEGRVHTFEVSPANAGLKTARLADLKGGDAAHNAAALRALLAGTPGAYRDIVVLNSAAALVVAGKAATLAEGARLAEASIDDGAARRALDCLVALTNQEA